MSYSHVSTLPSGLQTNVRGRCSQIQNNVLTVSCQQHSWEILSELQPLSSKIANVIAQSIIDAARSVIKSIVDGCSERSRTARVRVVHILVADSINTNKAAAVRVYKHFSDASRALHIDYCMVTVQCTSHQANLAVQVAICGEALATPIDNNILCGTAVRLY